MSTRKKIIITVWVTFGLSILAFLVRLIWHPELGIRLHLYAFLVSTIAFASLALGFWGINLALNRVLPYEKSLAGRIAIQLLAGMFFAFAMRTVVLLVLEDTLPIKLDKLFRTAIYIVDFFMSAAVNLIFFASYFFGQWKLSIQKAERLEREKAQVRYDNLKNQLNPHFLFNSLTSLNSLIHENPELASDFLKHLSKLYRYLLDSKELVPLEKELSFLDNYLFMLKTRFGGALIVDVSVEDSQKKQLIVPATVQGLLENALKHNIILPDNPLRIQVFTKNNLLIVENNLQRKKLVETSNKQGLENLKTLYSFLSGVPVEVRENSDTFAVKIPLIQND